ncbi:MAG: aspartate-semialdehyde dehydrogenase [Deltaproteobacteria bacterium]|nr:aspartate-semialdehyde dehydrogenase [Deltaproteobacteria bacterium]
MKKLRVGVLGATGMVGQRFVSLLDTHPWFEVAVVAASSASTGKSYSDAVAGRWTLPAAVPAAVGGLMVRDASQVAAIAEAVDFVFCAVDMTKEETARLEESYARAETPVVSNNSAHRGTPDVPMMIPELNAEHGEVIPIQRRRLGVSRGFVAVKPNCSLQSYVPAIHPLLGYGPKNVVVSTYQAISGAGKTFESWPEMVDNVIPFIRGEEEKSEKEPLKIWGTVGREGIVPASTPIISAQCVRVPATDGHLATVSISFERKPNRDDILQAWLEFRGPGFVRDLPSAPNPFLRYFEDETRPQTRLDRDAGRGMAISIGRLRSDAVLDYRFVALSHNTVRGAAGGGVLTAEALVKAGYIEPK